MSYTVTLPHYSVGADCYKEVPEICSMYGKNAVVIGGKTALQKTRPYLEEALQDSALQVLDYLWYGGNSTDTNANNLISDPTVKKADMIFAVGGGRACDTVKFVASELHKPVFTFPTLASNCAAVTAIGVFYNDDGSLNRYVYPTAPMHMFLNTAVIADSPRAYLWAGIGDALSKQYEAEYSSRNDALSHSALMGVRVAEICTDPLTEYGAEALVQCEKREAGFALEQVALDIIVSTGVTSLLVAPKTGEYYYNSTLAHCVYNGSTVTKHHANHLHGEVVSLGVLCLLKQWGNEKELKRCLDFNYSIQLPVCFDDVEIEESEFDAMADIFTKTTEWKTLKGSVTREQFLETMREMNRMGREYKKARE